MAGVLDGPALTVREIHVRDTEALRVALGPFEIVE
jgi:hypothetical protein